MYEVTATRKRPQTFENLFGQEFVVSTIKNAVETSRIAHAYLFSGPRGVGKTSSARILAKALNCVHGPTAHPCGECSNCLEIAQGNSLDVIEIDGASNTSVNDVRVIRDEVLFPPQSGRYKIYIIDEVHMLSNSAFNALLKTIEEPPDYVVFIFATTETHKVPATIRSRCQQFHFQLLPLQTIKGLLAETASEMGLTVEDEALLWIAKESTGSMRDAYTLFDQVAAFSDNDITLAKIQDKLGLIGVAELAAIVESSYRQAGDDSLMRLQKLLASGVSVEQAVKEFAELFRTLLLVCKGVTDADILGLDITTIPATVLNAFNEEQLEAALELFLRLYRDIRFSLNPRFELELAVSRLSSLAFLTSSAALMKRLSELQNNLLAAKESALPAVRPLRTTAVPPQKTPPELTKEVAKQVTAVIEDPPATQPQTSEKPLVTIAPSNRNEQEIVIKSQNQSIVEEEQPVTTGVQQQPKTVSMDILPTITQQLAVERNPLGIIMSQVVAINQSEVDVTMVFPSRFAMQSAKQGEEKIRQLVKDETGYDGRLSFAVLEPKPSEAEERHSTDEIVNLVKTVFRGDVV